MASTTELVTESMPDLSENKPNENGTAKPDKKTFKAMTMQERKEYVKEVITVEPLIALYCMAAVLAYPALISLELEKSCKSDNGFNDTICSLILKAQTENITTENTAVQRSITAMHSWQTPIQNVMPILLVLFIGSYSDRHKIRKPFLLLPIFGEFFSCMACVMCAVYMRELPLAALGIAQTVIPSFFGGPTMIVMAAFSLISDVSTLEMRTLRIGILQIVLNACGPVINVVSGNIFEKLGYVGSLVCVCVLYVMAFVYGIFWIKEPSKPVDVGNSKKSMIADMFDPHHAADTFSILLKEKKGNMRLHILLIMLVLFLYSGVVSGESNLFFLYSTSVYHWTVVDLTHFMSFNLIIHLIGTSIALPLFTKVFKLHDMTITAIAFLDKIACNVIFILIASGGGGYIGTNVSIIQNISGIALRSYASKVVSEADAGKAQSLFAIVETLAQTVFVPIYNQGIYSRTIEIFPQAFFLAGIVIISIAILVTIWLYFLDKRGESAPSENGIELQNGKFTVVETTHM